MTDATSDTPVKTDSNETQPVAAPADPPAVKEEVPTASPAFNVDTMDMKAYLKHVSLWNDPKLSGKYLLLILFVFYYTGPNGYNFGSFVCLAFIERAVIVFGFDYAAQKCKEKENSLVKKFGSALHKTGGLIKSFTKIPDAKSISFWIEGISTYLETKITAGLSAVEKAETDARMFKVVCGHLIVFSLLFAIFSIRTLCFGALFLALTLPGIYSKQQEKIDPILEKVQDAAKPHVEKLTAKGKEIGELVMQKVNEVSQQATAKLNEMKKSGAVDVESKKDN